jgi:uncharacterized phage protein gp47/JayE
MIYSFKELTTPVTLDEARTAIYDVLAAVGVTTTGWKPGAVVRTICTAVAILFVAAMTLISLIAGNGFLELSSGDWLTAVARYVYGVTRKAATFAEGKVTLINTSGGIYELDPDELVLSNGLVTYRNTQTFTLAANSTLTIDVRATIAGTAGTALANTITKLETPLTGVSCANANALIGTDEETDPALRLRCLDKLGARSPNGPADAYAYFARSATLPDGTSAGIVRVRTLKDLNGHVTTYVASASGEVAGDAEDTATPLGAAHDSIQRNAVPLCVTEDTESAAPKTIDHSYSIWAYDSIGLDPSQLMSGAAEALDRFYAERPIGGDEIEGSDGKVYVNTLESVLRFRPEIFRVELHSPANDVALLPHEVPKRGLNNLSQYTKTAPPSI